MKFKIIKEVYTSERVKELLPLPPQLAKIKAERDDETRAVLSGADKRLMVIIGPCSADNETAVCDYITRLARCYDKIKEKVFIIPRIYTNKPRTRGDGYKGMYHQPDAVAGETDIQAGILALRHMHIKAISESGLTAADEMLYPENSAYVDDLLTYITVGARSCENQGHRLVASGLNAPVGIKNPMHGSHGVMLNAIYAAQRTQEFMFNGTQVLTEGNAFAHAILRGAVDVYGNNIPNYHYEDVVRLTKLYADEKLSNPAIVIDCSHSNSGKDYAQQPRVVKEILNNRNDSAFGALLKGLMLESYIEDGAQNPSDGIYGKSVTDGCLGWQKTERLLYEIAEKV